MTKEQVQALRDAGIAENAIIDRILAETATAADDQSAAQAVPEVQPEPEAQPEQKAAPAPEPKPADRTDEILAAITKLTGALQIQNQHRGRPGAQPESVDDILASVLKPPGAK